MKQKRSEIPACQTEVVQAREGFSSTRREFLAGAAMVSTVALTSPPELAAAQVQAPGSAAPEMQKIGEITHKDGKLRAVITVLSEERMVPWKRDQPDRKAPIRYFEGKNADGEVVWPPAIRTGPLPGPTLRGRVGDQVEITFLNHVDVADFAQTGKDLDKAETGQGDGCDELFAKDGDDQIQRLYPDIAGDASTPGSPRHCFHASSTANLHFHGTHVTPDGLGDNVLLQLRPSSRVQVSAEPKRITKPDVTESVVEADFKSIFNNGPPAKWSDLPATWRTKQLDLLDKYDQTIPAGFHLLEPTKQRIAAGLWPQFAIGAYPYCFKLTKYTENAAGDPDPYRMGQCPGTHWYHAHKHGSTATNVLNGMAGIFVIEGDYDDALEKIYPDLKDPQKDTQKVLIVQNFAEAPNLARGTFLGGHPSLWVNGQLRPKIKMRPGQIQLWRMVNASIRAVSTILGFTSKGGAVPEIRQIAQDGVQFHPDNYLNQPLLRQRRSGTPSNTFAPGNRVDLLVRAPLRVGFYDFTVLDTTRDEEEVLLSLEVAGAPTPMDFPTAGNYPEFPKFLRDIDPDKIRIRRKLDFGWDPPNLVLRNFPPAPQFTIDGRRFSGDRYDQTMVLGDFEEWTLTNSTARIAHPFHIHVNPFQVVEIYDPNSPDQLYKPDKNFVWQDVIAIPPAKLDSSGQILLDPLTGKAREPGYVKIRHPFVDFPGSYVLHCHMLAHEDRGMMQLIRVIPGGGQANPGAEEATMIPHH